MANYEFEYTIPGFATTGKINIDIRMNDAGEFVADFDCEDLKERVDGLLEAVKWVAPVATSIGYSACEVTAMLSVLADEGIEGSDAGALLNQVMLKAKVAGGKVASVINDMEAAGASVKDYFETFGVVPLRHVLVLRDNLSSIQ